MTLPQTKTETNEEGEEVTSEPFTVRHEGSVFFPLPDGTALLYNLLGTADEPVEQDNFEKTAAAKEKMIFERKMHETEIIVQIRAVQSHFARTKCYENACSVPQRRPFSSSWLLPQLVGFVLGSGPLKAWIE